MSLGTRELDDLAHRPARSDRLGDVSDDPTRHFHRYERIAKNVGVGGEDEILKPFSDAEETNRARLG